ncbi:MAG: O-antigen ligase family protein [Chlamydiales bacterium]|nr:O-antigen ligase family protein [Chlamydiales bacterium]
MIYKVIIFWIGSIVFTLWGLFACRANKAFVYVIFGLMIFALTDPDNLSITFFAHPDYKMATRGFEIHLADVCAFILFLHLWTTTPAGKLSFVPPLTLPQLLFILVAALSWLFASPAVTNPLAAMQSALTPDTLQYGYAMETVLELKLYPLFEISKLFRGLLIFWVCVNLSADKNIIRTIYVVFSVLIIYFTIKSLILRYIMGVHRVTAGIGHYNNFNTFMGLMGAFLIPVAFSSKKFLISGFMWFLVVCTVLCIILTISRSALAAFGIAMIVATPILLFKYMNAKNIFFLMCGGVACLALLGKAHHTLMERFTIKNPTVAAFEGREALKNEARMMAMDYPFGVGMGNFSAWSILRYSAQTGAELGNFAHNSFYLTLGELGYPGLVAFWIFWLRYAQVGFIGLFYRLFSKDSFALSAMMGANLSIIFLMPQLWFQFTYRATPIYLLVHIILGIGVGQYLLARRERIENALLESRDQTYATQHSR